MSTTPITEPTPTRLPVGDWRIVPAESELGFQTRILFGLVPVRGEYGDYTGELNVDDTGTATGSLNIDAATVSTGIKKRDRHLRSGDFFAVDEHPHMRFDLDTVEAGAPGTFQLSGRLSVRGQALAIKAPVSVEQLPDGHIRIDADFAVDHKRSGLGATGSGWRKVPEALQVHAALLLESVD